jgi:hypothetical protein
MSTHTVSHASDLYFGNSVATNHTRRGIPLSPVTYADLGTPATLSTTAYLNGATSTNMPNAATTTYTYPSAGSAPQNGTLGATGTADVPRNIVVTMTHATSVVACTVLITGKDVYGSVMSESFTIPATGTTQTANGKKAFKSITTVAITSAGNATTNTCNIGTGAVLGLPYILTDTKKVMLMMDGVPQTTLGTLTVADTNTATTTTGDVRGTWSPNSAPNSSRTYSAWFVAVPASANSNSANCAYGLNQA